MDTDESWVEVFATRDRMSAQAAVDEVLEPEGIDAAIHDRVSHMIPAPATMEGSYFLAVPESQAARATAALREALDGGALDGELLATSSAPASP